MAKTTVFVDDAVRGRLPAVCAKEGVPTRDQLRVREPVGNRAGLGIAWLLILAGPLGWLGLLVISVSRGGRVEQLQVTLPLSEAVYRRLQAARRLENVGLALLLGGIVVGVVAIAGAGFASSPLGSFAVLAVLVAIVAGVVTIFAGRARQQRERVDIELDASHRWVRLGRVHPAFAAACDAQEHARTAADRTT